MVNYIAPINEGLGDLLVSLPAVRALCRRGETWLVLRSPKQEGVAEHIDGLSGWIQEPDLIARGLDASDLYLNLRNHPLQTEHVWGSAEFEQKFGPLTIIDILERICADYGLDADFVNLIPLRAKPLKLAEEKVLLIPGTAGKFKCWPAEYWMRLHDRLKNDGIDSVVIGQPTKAQEVRELVEAGLPWLPTPTFADALDAISSCQAVISVDTGLMHLSVQQGKPTVAIYQNKPLFLRRQSNCSPVIAPACPEECRQTWLSKPLNKRVEYTEWSEPELWSCPIDGARRCMTQVPPDLVYSKLRELVPAEALR